MRIAILTLPIHSNYGGILQAYALQTTLQRLGHEVEILQKDCWIPPLRDLMPRYIRRVGAKLLKRPSQEIFIEKNKWKEKLIIQSNLDRFKRKHLRMRIISSLKDVDGSEYDAVVVGSDQIWRKIFFTGMWCSPMEYAYAGFCDKNIKRISYAASFGLSDCNEYTPEEITLCKRAISRFEAVSVREDTGIELCKNVFGVEAVQVVDPTMLLTANDYIDILEATESHESGEILTYILDNSIFKEDVVKKVEKEFNYTSFSINRPENDRSIPIIDRIQPSMDTWLSGFRKAKVVITDSFHACVFSIIFNKPFIAIGNKGRGMTRFDSLLKQFGQEMRLITNHYPGREWLYEIMNCPNVNLDAEREGSISFLRENLSK